MANLTINGNLDFTGLGTNADTVIKGYDKIIDMQYGNTLSRTQNGSGWGWYIKYANGMVKYGGYINALNNPPSGEVVRVYPPLDNIRTLTVLLTAYGATQRTVTVDGTNFPTESGAYFGVWRKNSSSDSNTGTYFSYEATGFIEE